MGLLQVNHKTRLSESPHGFRRISQYFIRVIPVDCNVIKIHGEWEVSPQDLFYHPLEVRWCLCQPERHPEPAKLPPVANKAAAVTTSLLELDVVKARLQVNE